MCIHIYVNKGINAMKNPSYFINLLTRIRLWNTLRVIAIIILILVVYNIVAEAYDLGKSYVWLKEKILNLTWNPPDSEFKHYRVEISKTDLLAEPVRTYLSYNYTNSNDYKIELKDDHSYVFRVQAVNDYGVLSDFSDSTSLFIYEGGEIAKQALPSESTPSEFSLSQNYPNPFNSQTTIEYEIPSSGGGGSGKRVQFTIYNILGQRVNVLVDEAQTPGKYHIVWNGRDDAGREVASGHYLYQLIAGGFKSSKKMIYMK